MKKTQLSRLYALILCFVLVAAMALSISGCGTIQVIEPQATATPAVKTDFTFTVVHADGSSKEFAISTDAETVGAALLAEGLISGEDSQYGLYVKTVDGELADYDTDGSYWAFYINGEYAMTGVDATPAEEGAVYTFAVEGTAAEPEMMEVGQGAVRFTFTVRDADGNENVMRVLTDAATVGEALLENDLIAGVESQYGLYVKEVMGIVADYDVDGSYWAFYINGEYASTGVDSTAAENGAEYMFAVEK